MTRGVSQTQGVAAFGAVEQPCQWRRLRSVGLVPLAGAAELELGVDLFPGLLVDDTFMLAGVDRSFVRNRARVEDIGQQQSQRHPVKRPAEMGSSGPTGPGLGPAASQGAFFQN